MTEHAEVAAALADGRADIALLPEPNVTAVIMKNSEEDISYIILGKNSFPEIYLPSEEDLF